MPSPFPGMDPFIEAQAWMGFHSRLNTAMANLLVPEVRPRYLVEVEQYIYVERDSALSAPKLQADIAVALTDPIAGLRSTGSAVIEREPVAVEIPLPEETIEHYLEIRTLASRELVTVIELLSPTNKAASGAGRAEYLRKRAEILQSPTNLVEIDLLRGGQRLPTSPPAHEPACPRCRLLRVRQSGQPAAGRAGLLLDAS